MTLQEEVVARVPNQTLIELTRPKDESEQYDVDGAILESACDDAEAEIETYTGCTYADYDSDRRFVRLAVTLVLLILREYAAQGGPGNERIAAERKAWEQRARDLAKVTARDRILPETSSELTPEPEVGPGEVRGPAFTERFFRDYQPEPRQPGG